VSFDGLALDVMGLDDLKTHKRTAARLKELADPEALAHIDRTA
jgi:hypothetical protein